MLIHFIIRLQTYKLHIFLANSRNLFIQHKRVKSRRSCWSNEEFVMASTASLQSRFLMSPVKQPATIGSSRSSSFFCSKPACGGSLFQCQGTQKKRRKMTVVAAVGELSADSNNYLIAGAVTVALLGTAFPILFSRKDKCPECDGAGFVRKSGGILRANAARKDQNMIVCQNCNGLGKLNQIDK